MTLERDGQEPRALLVSLGLTPKEASVLSTSVLPCPATARDLGAYARYRGDELRALLGWSAEDVDAFVGRCCVRAGITRAALEVDVRLLPPLDGLWPGRATAGSGEDPDATEERRVVP